MADEETFVPMPEEIRSDQQAPSMTLWRKLKYNDGLKVREKRKQSAVLSDPRTALRRKSLKIFGWLASFALGLWVTMFLVHSSKGEWNFGLPSIIAGTFLAIVAIGLGVGHRHEASKLALSPPKAEHDPTKDAEYAFFEMFERYLEWCKQFNAELLAMKSLVFKAGFGEMSRDDVVTHYSERRLKLLSMDERFDACAARILESREHEERLKRRSEELKVQRKLLETFRQTARATQFVDRPTDRRETINIAQHWLAITVGQSIEQAEAELLKEAATVGHDLPQISVSADGTFYEESRELEGPSALEEWAAFAQESVTKRLTA